MRHARPDYERIQDPAGLIPEDEPVFLLRGQDAVAPEAVRCWADMAEARGAHSGIVAAARLQAARMDDYQIRIGGGRVPDMPDEEPFADAEEVGALSGEVPVDTGAAGE